MALPGKVWMKPSIHISWNCHITTFSADNWLMHSSFHRHWGSITATQVFYSKHLEGNCKVSNPLVFSVLWPISSMCLQAVEVTYISKPHLWNNYWTSQSCSCSPQSLFNTERDPLKTKTQPIFQLSVWSESVGTGTAVSGKGYHPSSRQEVCTLKSDTSMEHMTQSFSTFVFIQVFHKNIHTNFIIEH